MNKQIMFRNIMSVDNIFLLHNWPLLIIIELEGDGADFIMPPLRDNTVITTSIEPGLIGLERIRAVKFMLK